MATQEQLDLAFEWAKQQVGKPYVLGTFGDTFDCSTYMSGIATMIRDGKAARWFTTHPFHGGGENPVAGWFRNLESPFMVGITDEGVGHMGGTLLGVNFEATAAGNRVVRMGPEARGARDSMYKWVYGFKPAILEGVGMPTENILYTVKDEDTLSSIAYMHNANIDKIVELNDLISVGNQLNIPVVSSDSPEPVPPPVISLGTIKLSETGPYGTIEANKMIQSALNVEYGGVVVDGWYGPQTMQAYTRWQEQIGESARPWDGMPGSVSLPALGEKYNFEVVVDGPPKGPSGAAVTEPAHNYTRTTFGGRTVNQRTRDMLLQAQALYGKSFPITQGSYNTGVPASAGTHDGGGVIDIGDVSTTLLKALRQVGFAAWIRTPSEGFSYHIHAVAIGDRELSSSAKRQITAYYNGRNGLANNGPDTAPASVGRPYPAWAAKYGAPVQ